MNKLNTNVTIEDKKLILSRDFNATPELLFEVWSSCKHLKHWWGPREWPMDECEMDFREGGEWRYCLRGPNEGDESWGKAIYRQIDKAEKLVYDDHFTDAEGKLLDNMPTLRIAVEFVPQNGKTRQVSTVFFDSNEDRDMIHEMGMAEGFDSSGDRLADYLDSL